MSKQFEGGTNKVQLFKTSARCFSHGALAPLRAKIGFVYFTVPASRGLLRKYGAMALRHSGRLPPVRPSHTRHKRVQGSNSRTVPSGTRRGRPSTTMQSFWFSLVSRFCSWATSSAKSMICFERSWSPSSFG